MGGRVSVGWVDLTVPRVEATSPARQAALLTEKHLPSEHLWVCSILQCSSGPLLTSSSTPCQTRAGQPAHHRVPGKPCHDARQPALNGQCVEGVAHLLLCCSLRAIPGHVNQDEIRDQHDPSYMVPCLPRQSLRRGELLVRLCVPFSKACGGFPPGPPPASPCHCLLPDSELLHSAPQPIKRRQSTSRVASREARPGQAGGVRSRGQAPCDSKEERPSDLGRSLPHLRHGVKGTEGICAVGGGGGRRVHVLVPAHRRTPAWEGRHFFCWVWVCVC